MIEQDSNYKHRKMHQKLKPSKNQLIKLMFKLKQKKINNKKLKRNNNIVD
jgi:hypothetical protein